MSHSLTILFSDTANQDTDKDHWRVCVCHLWIIPTLLKRDSLHISDSVGRHEALFYIISLCQHPNHHHHCQSSASSSFWRLPRYHFDTTFRSSYFCPYFPQAYRSPPQVHLILPQRTIDQSNISPFQNQRWNSRYRYSPWAPWLPSRRLGCRPQHEPTFVQQHQRPCRPLRWIVVILARLSGVRPPRR